MNFKQLNAIKGVLAQTHGNTSLNGTAIIILQIFEDCIDAAIKATVESEAAKPLKTETEDRRSIATYDDLKAFIDTYIRTQVGSNAKVHLDHDTVLLDYLEPARIDELAWMIGRNFKIAETFKMVKSPTDLTLDEFINAILDERV